MKTALIALRALLAAALFLTLWAWIALGLKRYDALYGLSLPDWSRMVAIPVLLLGAAIAFACVATFAVRGQGTPAPFDPPREFVAVGLYRYVRNPMYIGGAILLGGFGLWESSAAIVLFCAPWLLLFHLLVVLYEEPVLRRKFGAPYEAYLRSVPRWLPRIPASRISQGAGGQW